MNDKHEREERQQALELDALLEAWLAGRSAAAHGQSQLPPHEAQFARQVVQLSQEIEPDPAFVISLENRLRYAAQKQAAAHRPEVTPRFRLFWQQLMESLSGRRVMVTAGALAVVAILVLIAWPLLNRSREQNEPPIALIPGVTNDNVPVTTESLPPEIGSDMAVITGTQDIPPLPIEPSPSPEAIAETTIDPATRPQLPPISDGGVIGLGGGGGGPGFGGGGDSASMMPFENRLTEAQYILNAPLPDTPAPLTVYQYPQADAPLAQVKMIAAQMGFTGPIYYDAWYDRALENSEFGWPGPRPYQAFNGAISFNNYGNSFNYFNNGLLAPGSFWQLMPYDQGLPLALTFATENGLLDFPYETGKNPLGEEISFYRLINGIRNGNAELTITVMENGEILSAYLVPFSVYTPVGDYPIISAAAAWELAQMEPDYRTVTVSILPDPATMTTMPAPDPRFRSWYRTYQNNDPIFLDTYPQILLPAEPGVPPLIRANEYSLTGDETLLAQIATLTEQNIRLRGTVIGDTPYGQQIRVEQFEVLTSYPEWQFREGTIRRTDTQVFLETTMGETLLIPNAPADLPDGERVGVNGASIEPGEPYRVFNWSNMDRYVEIDFFPEEPEIFPTPAPITEVTIEQIELIYLISFAYHPEFNGPGVEWLQPAWRFSGRTNTGELIQITVQAIPPEFHAPPPPTP